MLYFSLFINSVKPKTLTKLIIVSFYGVGTVSTIATVNARTVSRYATVTRFTGSHVLSYTKHMASRLAVCEGKAMGVGVVHQVEAVGVVHGAPGVRVRPTRLENK